jgi:gamma-glutamyl:cysteine ligase YbdK (ATP-grasp superfamily)
MTPTTDERIASVIRALTEVVLPHLPPEASLAQEQVHLAIGHLQILQSQFDEIPAFEREEHDDAKAIGAALAAAVTGGAETQAAVASLETAVAAQNVKDVRGLTRDINQAVDRLVRAASRDGSGDAKSKLSDIILQYEKARVMKDRIWFLSFGFDTIEIDGHGVG